MRRFADRDTIPMTPENQPQPMETTPSDLERRMACQPMRAVPTAWKAEILSTRKPVFPWSLALREFFWPTPWACGALLGAWVLVAGFASVAERTARDGASMARRDSGRRDVPLLDWRQQQALISALLEESPTPERQPAAPLRPRSELRGPRFGLHDTALTLSTPV